MKQTVQIWYGETFPGVSERVPIVKMLSPSERARAKRFSFLRDRDLYTFAHAMLRTILGELLQRAPCEIEFITNEYGKPSLLADPWHFNLSHAGEFAVLAVSSAGPVGVDVEQRHRGKDLRDLATRFFSPLESKALERYAGEDFATSFVQIWTRKEAYIKAVGQGLSLPLNTFTVPCPPQEEGVIRLLSGDAPSGREWEVQSLSLHPDYAGAVCAEPGFQVKQHPKWSFSPEFVAPNL